MAHLFSSRSYNSRSPCSFNRVHRCSEQLGNVGGKVAIIPDIGDASNSPESFSNTGCQTWQTSWWFQPRFKSIRQNGNLPQIFEGEN